MNEEDPIEGSEAGSTSSEGAEDSKPAALSPAAARAAAASSGGPARGEEQSEESTEEEEEEEEEKEPEPETPTPPWKRRRTRSSSRQDESAEPAEASPVARSASGVASAGSLQEKWDEMYNRLVRFKVGRCLPASLVAPKKHPQSIPYNLS